MPEELLLVSEAAKRAGVSPWTMRDYATRGVVADLRDSAGRRLFTSKDVEVAKSYRERIRRRGRG